MRLPNVQKCNSNYSQIRSPSEMDRLDGNVITYHLNSLELLLLISTSFHLVTSLNTEVYKIHRLSKCKEHLAVDLCLVDDMLYSFQGVRPFKVYMSDLAWLVCMSFYFQSHVRLFISTGD